MSQTKIRVAVVDDDLRYLRALERLLQAADFAPVSYSSAEAFLDKYRDHPMDCALLDVRLGSMTGFEVARRLAAEHAPIPIIFMTAHDEQESREQARKAGGVAYLRKPFPAQPLFEAIKLATRPRPASDVSPVSAPDTNSSGFADTTKHP